MKKNALKIVATLFPLFLAACSPFNTSSSSSSSSFSSSSSPSSSSSSFSSSSESSSASSVPLYSTDDSYENKAFSGFSLSEKVVSFSDTGEASISNEWATFSLNKAKDGDFFTLEKGGYFTNSTPLTYVSAIEVSYERKSDYGQLYYSYSDYEITSPNASIFPIYNDTKVTFDNGGYPYFSIYAAVGEFNIKSISVFATEERADKQTNDIDVYSVNDVHGAIEYNVSGSSKQIGASRMTSYFAREGQKNINGSVFLSSGDMWQGSVDSNMNKGEFMNEWMNMVGFESMTIGNHEFDWKPTTIETNSKAANFPYLCINLRNEKDEMPSWVSSSKIIYRQGIKIGIIGAIGRLESSIETNSLSGYYFSPSYISLIDKEAIRLRNEEGCSLVFLSYHDSDFDTTNCHNIDAVFEGHTHMGYSNIDGFGIPHVQCYGNGSGIQHLKFKKMDDGSYKYDSEGSDTFSYTSASSLSTNAPFEEMNVYFEKQISDIKNKVVGTASAFLSKDDIGEIGAKSLYRYAEDNYADYNVTAAIINTGGVRQTIPAGEVTFGQIYAVFPFDNTNNICSIRGADLKRNYLNSSYYYCYSKDDSSSFSDNETYNVITLSFISDGNNGRRYLTVLERDDYYLRDIVADYFREVSNG